MYILIKPVEFNVCLQKTVCGVFAAKCLRSIRDKLFAKYSQQSVCGVFAAKCLQDVCGNVFAECSQQKLRAVFAAKCSRQN